MTADPNMAGAAAVPAICVSKFAVLATPASVRLVFGEAVMADRPTVYHAAVQLSASDARWLADMINERLLEAEKLAK